MAEKNRKMAVTIIKAIKKQEDEEKTAVTTGSTLATPLFLSRLLR